MKWALNCIRASAATFLLLAVPCLGGDFQLREVSALPHRYPCLFAAWMLNENQMALRTDSNTLLIANVSNPDTPVNRINLFDASDMAFIPAPNLLLMAGRDLVAFDPCSKGFQLLNLNPIRSESTEPIASVAEYFGRISLDRTKKRFLVDCHPGFALGNVTNVSETAIVESDFSLGSFLPDGRVIQCGDHDSRICQLDSLGVSKAEMRFRRKRADGGVAFQLPNPTKSGAKDNVEFASGVELVRTEGTIENSIVVLSRGNVVPIAGDSVYETFEVWQVAGNSISSVSIVSAVEFGLESPQFLDWRDTLIVPRGKHSGEFSIIHFFTDHAWVATVRTNDAGRTEISRYWKVEYKLRDGAQLHLYAVSAIGPMKFLVVDDRSRLFRVDLLEQR